MPRLMQFTRLQTGAAADCPSIWCGLCRRCNRLLLSDLGGYAFGVGVQNRPYVSISL